MFAITAIAWRELTRRMVVLACLVGAAILLFGHGQGALASLAAAFGIGVYLFLPRPRPPEGALFAERMPSVHMPDLAGLILAVPFLSIPFIVSALEPWMGGPWGLMLFMWPPGLIALAIFWFASGYQCSWILLRPDGVDLTNMRGTRRLDFSDIRRVRFAATGLPRWVSGALFLLGGVRGAGIALLHGNRKSHSAVVELRSGGAVRLPLDAFPDMDRVLTAMVKAGVDIDTASVSHPAAPRRQKEGHAR